MPHGTYQISIEGTNFIKVIYFEGGVISIGETYNVSFEALKLVLAPAAPPIIIHKLPNSILKSHSNIRVLPPNWLFYNTLYYN